MKRALMLAAISVLFPAVARAACGRSAVCDDVETSFAGTLITVGVRLDWSTDSENTSVLKYDIYRYDCGTPSTCSVFVTSVTPTGTCDELEEYSYTDDPPDPDEDWN